jgi:transcription elongation factor GreA
MMTDQYLTSERLAELKEELENLKNESRKDVAKRLKRAKELGDLSENSEYQEAREEQQKVELRISELENLTKSAVVIEKTATGTVSVGSTVDVEKDGQKTTMTIVGPNEANPEDGKISHASPIGAAFLRKKAGDTVLVKTPKGKIEYKILSVK